MKDVADTKTYETPLNDPYTVFYKGEPALRLNERLIVQQGLSQDQVEAIKQLHVERMMVEDVMGEPSTTKEQLQTLFKTWTSLQFDLQEGWGFPQDANYHPSHWLPRCTCAKIDNNERLGTPYKVVTKGCPIHDTGQFE